MYFYLFGLGLVAIGVVLHLVGRGLSKGRAVSASHGSIAIGGNSSGPIVNTNTEANRGEGLGHNWIHIIAIITEVAGITVTVWHASHSAVIK